MAIVYALLVGVAMGALIQRVGASSPAMIGRNLRLESLSIIKFMATTIAVGTIGVYLLGALGMPMHLDIKPTYVIGVVIGGLVFGVGFALGGYCPGTCVVGAAEGRRDALWAIGGGLLGALLFTLAYGAMQPVVVKPLDYGKITLASLLHLPTVVVAVLLGAVLLAAVTLLPTERPAPVRTPGGGAAPRRGPRGGRT
jgi:uncharacterized membrane protein YedE/YeeE